MPAMRGYGGNHARSRQAEAAGESYPVSAVQGGQAICRRPRPLPERFRHAILAGQWRFASPHAPCGGLAYHEWLERDLPPGVTFPYGVTPWLRASSPFGEDEPRPSVLQELRNIDRGIDRRHGRRRAEEREQEREYRYLHLHEISPPALESAPIPRPPTPPVEGAECSADGRWFVPDETSPSGWSAWTGPTPDSAPSTESVPAPEPAPSDLVRCIHAAYERVTSERVADWFGDLDGPDARDMIAFIREAASTDSVLRAAGNLIATRRAGFPALIVPHDGRRGRPKSETRNLYIATALFALATRYNGELDRPIRYKAEDRSGKDRGRDWCAVVAPAFGMTAARVRAIWDNLSEIERGAVKKHR